MTEPQPHGPARATAPISEAETSPRAAAFGRALARLLGRSSSGPAIAVTDASGTFVVGKGVPTLSVIVQDERAYLATLRRGSQGFAESYIDEWWDTDDLTGVVRSVMRGVDPMLSKLDWWTAKLLGPLTLWHRRQRPTKDHDLRNVRAHYDLPGELYEVMLDPTMLYSCALFGEDPFDLEGAQIAKMERICSALELNESDHLLEIGTGWGGFAIYAATTRGCRVTTTTISENQCATARARVAAAGLSDRITVLDCDYRDLTGTYDKLVSIEMIEAVDWRLHDTFFAACAERLKPDGLMLLQAITIEDRSFDRAKFADDFIKTLVFPGGCLPSVGSIRRSVASVTDLVVLDTFEFGEHYATTLRRWWERFDAGWDAVAPEGFGEGFRRLWKLYLCYCEAAFLERHIGDVQMLLAGPKRRLAPEE